MPDALPVPPRPRERILAAARDLFHRNGIRGVGVDAIAEAAGTNKMTLYRHFDSKDDLVVAYLRSIAAEGEVMAGHRARKSRRHAGAVAFVAGESRRICRRRQSR